MAPSKAQKAATAQRRAQAIQLRMAGMIYEDIAARLGYSSRQAAARDIQRALDIARGEQHAAAAHCIALDLMRLDRLQTAAWPEALRGDPTMTATVLKI